MPRDLFAETLNHVAGPRRSKWTIAGSVVAHIGVVAALAVIPLMSMLDNVVIHASDLVYNAPSVVMPVMASPPPKSAAPTPAVNPNAAPLSSPLNPVTEEVSLPNPGPPGPPGAIPDILNKGGGLIPGAGTGGLGPDTVAPPPPQIKKPLPVGGDIKAPTRTYYVDPVYPSVAVSVKQEGMVILEATIDESGTVKNVRVLRSVPLLDKAAVEAVSKWRYMPTKLNGVPVPVLLTVTVTFAIR